MWFFKETEERLALLDNNVTQSFDRVKTDIATLSQWVEYLNQKNQGQTQVIEELKRQIEQVPKTRQDIKLLVDSVYDYETMRERIRLIEQKIAQIELQRSKIEQIDLKFQDLPQQLRTIRAQVELMHEQTRDARMHETRQLGQATEQLNIPTEIPQINQRQPVSRFKEKVLKKLTQNSKEYVKGLILSHIHKYGKISGQHLRESIVDEQGLCSKSSFYRLLEEIEKDEQLTVLAEGKNKLYLAKKHV